MEAVAIVEQVGTRSCRCTREASGTPENKMGGDGDGKKRLIEEVLAPFKAGCEQTGAF